MPQQKPKRRRLIKIIPIALGIILLLLVGIFMVSMLKYSQLHHKVFTVVKSELAAIHLANASGIHKVYDSSCDNDPEVRSTRCMMSYDRYFGTNEEDPNKVLKDIDNNLTVLGWEISPYDKVYLTQNWRPGYSAITYSKGRGFGLEATLGVAEKDGLGSAESDYTNLQKQFKHVYSISVSTDTIPDNYK